MSIDNEIVRSTGDKVAPRKPGLLTRVAIGTLSIGSFVGGAGAVAGIGVAGYGVMERMAEWGAMKSCAEVGFTGDEETRVEDPEFVETCNDAYSTNHDGRADNDGEIHDTPFRRHADRHTGVGVGIIALGAGIAIGLSSAANRLHDRFSQQPAAIDPNAPMYGAGDWRPEWTDGKVPVQGGQ